MDAAEKKNLLPSWAVKAMIWCGPTLFFLLMDTAIFGLVPEKEEIHFPRFDKVPGSGVIPEAPKFLKKKKLFGIFPI